jgi:glycosyltransferase involved in cell wall biosynthesis
VTLVKEKSLPMKRVTIAIPIYKRLQYIPRVLDVVRSQDYPNIDLLVSDNGMNGQTVAGLVAKHYPTARFRQNPTTVTVSNHFNQLIQEARGKYFVILADDDELTPNYVSDLVPLLERHPQASVALGVQETLDEAGTVLNRSSDQVPELLSGPEFIRAAWKTHEFGFQSFSTFLARTASLRASGGFPDTWRGTGNDDVIMVKLCFDKFVALSPRCVFKKRFYETSYGFSQNSTEFARGIKELLLTLDKDPILTTLARQHPAQWAESKQILVETAWKAYYGRWIETYSNKSSLYQWMKAAFSLPFIPAYYDAVLHTCVAASGSTVWRSITRRFSLKMESSRRTS